MIEKISDIKLTKSEAINIKQRFTTNAKWENIEKNFASFAAMLNKLPSFDGYREVSFLHDMLLDAICDEKGWPSGRLDHLI